MTIPYSIVNQDVRQWAQAHGMRVTDGHMEPGKAGEFDGISIIMNTSYALADQTYYLVHALGSIVRWSLSKESTQEMFDELRAAKQGNDRARLESAIDRYRSFETESSEFAVWILGQIGHADAVPLYTNFMRADLEALTAYHRRGQAPVWQDFFARWNEEVVAGHLQLSPFRPKEIPDFKPRKIEKQEILQKQPE